MAESPQETLAAARQRIEQVLQESLESTRVQMAAFHPDAPIAVEMLAAHLTSGGKRLRPLFCYFGHLACGGTGTGPILRVASSLELLHAFALIHDDVMDESPTRRGEPSLHVRIAAGLDDPRAEERARALAILVGDLALMVSDELFFRGGFAPDLVSESASHLFEMRILAIAGQYLDLTGRERLGSSLTIEEAERIARMKTAAYTTVKPLAIGAALARASEQQIKSLESYGTALGEAFQIVDDLHSGPDELDLQMGRPSWPIAWALNSGGPRSRDAVARVWGNPDVEPELLQEAQLALESEEVRLACFGRIAKLVAEAKHALDIEAPEGTSQEGLAVLNHLAELIGSAT